MVTTGGKLAFISGQVPEDALGNLVGKGDIEGKTRQVLTNLKAMVGEAGGTVADVVKITVFMVEIAPSSYETVARLRREFFVDGYPASTMVYYGGSKVPSLARLAD